MKLTSMDRFLARIEGAFIGWKLRALHAEADVAHLAGEVRRWTSATQERPGRGAPAVEAGFLRRRLREAYAREAELQRACQRAIDALDHPKDLTGETLFDVAEKETTACALLEEALGRVPRRRIVRDPQKK